MTKPTRATTATADERPFAGDPCQAQYRSGDFDGIPPASMIDHASGGPQPNTTTNRIVADSHG
jgi:hypothetical protein